MRALSDSQLVRRARAGRREAFDELVQRYQRRAVAVAYRLVGNLHDALEVCQDAWLRAHENLRTLKDPSRFGPWLLRIVTNQALNSRRGRGPRSCVNGCASDSPAWEDQMAEMPGAGEQPGAPLAADELAQRIRRELARLPERQRSALILFSFNDMPQKQVAQVLGCSVAAVKWHVFQARRKLRLRLADYFES
jgi:RNA polymerase sigma-70 factor (ECF subfamily)